MIWPPKTATSMVANRNEDAIVRNNVPPGWGTIGTQRLILNRRFCPQHEDRAQAVRRADSQREVKNRTAYAQGNSEIAGKQGILQTGFHSKVHAKKLHEDDGLQQTPSHACAVEAFVDTGASRSFMLRSLALNLNISKMTLSHGLSFRVASGTPPTIGAGERKNTLNLEGCSAPDKGPKDLDRQIWNKGDETHEDAAGNHKEDDIRRMELEEAKALGTDPVYETPDSAAVKDAIRVVLQENTRKMELMGETRIKIRDMACARGK
ncbi:hypothetical protein Efla_000540 [Eimeria flavescens]